MATLDLRPLSLGELLDRTFFLYRRNFWMFLGITALPYCFLLAIFIVIVPGVLLYLIPARGNVPPAFAVVAGVIVGILALVVFIYSAGATVFAVSEIYGGKQPTIRGSFRLAWGHAWTIFGVFFFSLLIVLGGFLALIIPGIYLLCRVPVATAAALIEDIGPADAIRRSFALTKNFAGRSGLIYLLRVALAYGVGFVFQLPFFVMTMIATATKQPQYTIFLWSMLAQVGNVLGIILVEPVPAIAFALFYYDLRIRKEAFDLQVMMKSIGTDPVPPPITGGVPSMFGRDAS